MPNKINSSINKGKLIDNKWEENIELNSLINDCINIENNINTIKKINEIMEKSKNNDIKIEFETEKEDIFFKQIKIFGKIKINNNNYFSFKECPININEDRRYIVSGDKKNIITKTGTDGRPMGTICENQLDMNKEEHTWIIKILKSKAKKIDVGIAPIDFDIKTANYNTYGWYLYCNNSTLDSGPPHHYGGKSTNLDKVINEVKIIMNMKKKSLKFLINNEDKGDSFTNIPIDKPLTPAVFLENKDDSIEIISC